MKMYQRRNSFEERLSLADGIVHFQFRTLSYGGASRGADTTANRAFWMALRLLCKHALITSEERLFFFFRAARLSHTHTRD